MSGRCLAGILMLAACGTTPPLRGQSWPEADALFHRDPRWLGADGAYSVPLGDGRILWLFGDTFVANTPAHVRSQSTMVHSTVAIQTGADPTTATIAFYWRGTATAPLSYFPEDGDRWYWPQHGIRLGKALVLFLSRVRPTPGQGLGFAGEGWRAVLIADASGAPDTWSPQLLSSTVAPGGIVAGAALNRLGDYVVSLAEREPGDHAGFLVRWRTTDLAAGAIDAQEWWTSDRGFVAPAALGGAPSVVIANAGPESSLHFDQASGRFVHVRSDGFGATNIVVSFAPAITGPWSTPVFAFRPPESDHPGAFVYAGKAHPELMSVGAPPKDGGAEGAVSSALAVTYAANSFDFAQLVADPSLYYPRFAILKLR